MPLAKKTNQRDDGFVGEVGVFFSFGKLLSKTGEKKRGGGVEHKGYIYSVWILDRYYFWRWETNCFEDRQMMEKI